MQLLCLAGKLLPAILPARWDCPGIRTFCSHAPLVILGVVTQHRLKGGWDKRPPGSRRT